MLKQEHFVCCTSFYKAFPSHNARTLRLLYIFLQRISITQCKNTSFVVHLSTKSFHQTMHIVIQCEPMSGLEAKWPPQVHSWHVLQSLRTLLRFRHCTIRRISLKYIWWQFVSIHFVAEFGLQTSQPSMLQLILSAISIPLWPLPSHFRPYHLTFALSILLWPLASHLGP